MGKKARVPSQAATGFTKSEYRELLEHFGESEEPLLRAFCRWAKSGLTADDCRALLDVDLRTIFAWVKRQKTSGLLAFDESIRFRARHRSRVEVEVTALFDVTTTIVTSRNPMDYSGKKGKCRKYQVTTTVSGVPIACDGPFWGRRHDRALLVPPLTQHVAREKILADLGYAGPTKHIVLPHKKPPRRELTPDQHTYNKWHSHLRSWVERSFAWLKRFRVVHTTTLSAKRHGEAVFAILCLEHIATRNVRRLGKEEALHDLVPGVPCTCDFVH